MQRWMSSPTARKSAWMLLVVFLWTMMGVQPLQAAVETCKDLRAASMPQCRDLTDKEMAAIVGGDTLAPIPGDSPWVNLPPINKGAGGGQTGGRFSPKTVVNPAGGNILVTQPIDLYSSGRGPVALTVYTNTANVLDSYSVFGQKSRLSIYVPLTESPSENPSADIKIAAPNGTMLYFTHDLNSGDWKTSTTASFTGVVNVRCKLVKTGGRYQLSCDGSPSLRELGTVVYKWGAVSGSTAQLNIILVDNDPNTTSDDYKASLEYDGSGKLTCAVDGAGNRTTFDYVPIQIPFQTNIEIGDVQFPGGQRVSFTYVNGGLMGQFNLASIVYPTQAGQPCTTVEYTVDVNGTISAIRDNGAVTSFGYWMLSINSVTDPLGNKTTWTYPSMTQTQDTVKMTPWGSTTTVTQDATSRTPLYLQDALGNRTTLSYDADSRPVTQALKIDGQLTTKAYGYDALTGKVASITYSGTGTSQIFAYNSDKDLQSATNEMGLTTTFTYNNHRVASISSPSGQLVTYVYNASLAGPTASISTREGGISTVTYAYVDTGTAAGKLKTVTDDLGNITTKDYDTSGRLVSVQVSPAAGTVYTSSFSYDDQGRTRIVNRPDLTTTEYIYDALALRGVKDPNGKTTSVDYWADGRLKVVTNAANETLQTSYGYLPATQESWKTVTNPEGKVTTYTYDADNRLKKIQFADNTQESYTYDQSGNLKSKTDANGLTTTTEYDTLGRLTRVDFPNDIDVRYYYDDAGRRIGMTDASGSTSYTYGPDGRVRSVRTTFTGASFGAKIVTYDYWSDGSRKSMTLPDGGITTYHYDDSGRLTWLKNQYAETTTFTYDNHDRMVKRLLNNGAYASYDYDSNDRMIGVRNIKRDASTVLCSFNYYYTDGARNDYDGNVLKAVQKLSDGNVYTCTYSYDNSYRLTYEGETAPNAYGYTYTYDKLGNRQSLVVTAGGRTTYAYDLNSNSEMDTEWSGSTTNTYAYDNDGNTLTKSVTGGAITTFSYNDANKVMKIAYPSGGTSSAYAYNGGGLRVKKVGTNGAAAYFIYDGSQLAMELDSAGSTVAAYTAEAGTQHRGSTSYYAAYDRLGSAWNLVTLDTAETIVGTYTYTAFGIATASDSVGSPFRYVGSEACYHDYSDSGLVLMGARYYSPTSGRFLTQDPIRSGLNWYAYTAGNPLNRVDPSGLYGKDPFYPGIPPEDIMQDCRDIQDWVRNHVVESICLPAGVIGAGGIPGAMAGAESGAAAGAGYAAGLGITAAGIGFGVPFSVYAIEMMEDIWGKWAVVNRILGVQYGITDPGMIRDACIDSALDAQRDGHGNAINNGIRYDNHGTPVSEYHRGGFWTDIPNMRIPEQYKTGPFI